MSGAIEKLIETYSGLAAAHSYIPTDCIHAARAELATADATIERLTREKQDEFDIAGGYHRRWQTAQTTITEQAVTIERLRAALDAIWAWADDPHVGMVTFTHEEGKILSAKKVAAHALKVAPSDMRLVDIASAFGVPEELLRSTLTNRERAEELRRQFLAWLAAAGPETHNTDIEGSECTN